MTLSRRLAATGKRAIQLDPAPQLPLEEACYELCYADMLGMDDADRKLSIWERSLMAPCSSVTLHVPMCS